MPLVPRHGFWLDILYPPTERFYISCHSVCLLDEVSYTISLNVLCMHRDEVGYEYHHFSMHASSTFLVMWPQRHVIHEFTAEYPVFSSVFKPTCSG